MTEVAIIDLLVLQYEGGDYRPSRSAICVIIRNNIDRVKIKKI